MDNEYLDYLNDSQLKLVKNYNLITLENINKIRNGDSIRLIQRSNLQFKHGGVVIKLVDNSIIIRNLSYRYNYLVSLDNYIILHKVNERNGKTRKFMEYLLNGLENKSIKVTKKTN